MLLSYCSRMIWISLILVVVVIASCSAVMRLFFRRLKRIETELWGAKQREADETAREAGEHADQGNGA